VVVGTGGWHTPPQRILTFALNGTRRLPPMPTQELVAVRDPSFAPNLHKETIGAAAFKRCAVCHGDNAVSKGNAPDLRESPMILSPARFNHIVQGGALRAQGMPPFTDLGPTDLDDIRQYLRARAQELAKASHPSH
jgi:quinohemoprotein ethanol dehydrogenase